MAGKYKLETNTFDGWKAFIIAKVAQKIRKLKISRKPQETKPILKDEEVIQ